MDFFRYPLNPLYSNTHEIAPPQVTGHGPSQQWRIERAYCKLQQSEATSGVAQMSPTGPLSIPHRHSGSSIKTPPCLRYSAWFTRHLTRWVDCYHVWLVCRHQLLFRVIWNFDCNGVLWYYFASNLSSSWWYFGRPNSKTFVVQLFRNYVHAYSFWVKSLIAWTSCCNMSKPLHMSIQLMQTSWRIVRCFIPNVLSIYS